MRILGIDPGSVATGWGVVEDARTGGSLVHCAHGTLRPPRGASLAVRLAYIHRGVQEVIALHAPEAAAIEGVFLANNPRSALVLGQARGAAITALGAAGLEVEELAPREIKQSVVGSGAATKPQIQQFVAKLLRLANSPPQMRRTLWPWRSVRHSAVRLPSWAFGGEHPGVHARAHRHGP